jgi:hypothetical protein
MLIKPASIATIILIRKANLEFSAVKWQFSSSVQALAPIISRQSIAEVRHSVPLDELFHDCSIDTP